MQGEESEEGGRRRDCGMIFAWRITGSAETLVVSSGAFFIGEGIHSNEVRGMRGESPRGGCDPEVAAPPDRGGFSKKSVLPKKHNAF